MNTKRKFLLFLSLISFSFSISAANESSYRKAWSAFLKNDRKTARTLFQTAIKSPNTKSDAYLSLAFLDWMEEKEDAAFIDFTKFYENSTNPYPYLYAMFSMPYTFASNDYLKPDRIAFLEKISTDPKMNGTLKAMVEQQLGQYYAFVNDRPKANEYYAKMGSINKWEVLGSFDNTSGSGFSKDWGAVDKPLTTDIFKNKVDADVTWYTPSHNKPNNWFYFDYYFPLDGAIMYAQSFVNSPSEQEVYMRTGTSGSLKIWVNDALIGSVPEERNCDLDIYGYKINLNKGKNRILVQIGQSEIDNANFLIRLTDADGNPVKGLTDQANFAQYTKSSPSEPQKILPFFAETYFEEQLKSNPGNILNSFLLSETYLRNDKAFEATELLKKIETNYPLSSLVSYRLAEAFSRAKNQTDYDKEMENVKKNDPESFVALQEFFNEAVKSEKYADATDILHKAKTLYGDNFTFENWELALASYQKKVDDLNKIVHTMYAKYPQNADLMNLNYSIENNISNNSPKAVSIVEDYCAKYFNSAALATLAGIYFDQGKTEEALEKLKYRVQTTPYATGYLDNLATVLYQMQRYDDASGVTDSILALAPYVADTYNSRGYIYKALKDEKKAKDNFSKSIYYAPTSYDSRSQLRQLENKKEVFDLFQKNDLKDIIAKAPSSKDYPEDNSVLLLNDNQLVVYEEGAKEYHNEIAIKILNQSGIDSWKQYGIDYNGNNQKLIIDKAEVVKSSGNIVKAESNGNTVVFTNLEVGDVLHLDYRIQDYSTGSLAKHFFDQFLMQYSIPSVLNRYSILVPKDKTFNYRITNGNVQPSITDVEGEKLYTWQNTNQAAVKKEPYRSPLIDVAPTLTYSSIPDWKVVSNWYKDITTSKFNSDYVLQTTYNQILKGHQKDTDLQKAKLFYEYILNEISYSDVPFMHSNFVPQKASRTITTRLGDCKDVATLFVALCRTAGIDANLVLISTRDNGKNGLNLPTINFNHCIAQLNVDSKTYYLELTDSQLPFGAALTMDLHSNILPIPFDDKSNLGDKIVDMDMPFRKPNSIEMYDTISIAGNDMQIKVRNVSTEAFASLMRNTYTDLGSADKAKALSQDAASGFTFPIKVSDYSFKGLNDLSDTVTYTCTIQANKALQDVAGMKILSFPWTYKIASLESFNLETRKYPFDLWLYTSADTKTEKITLNLPQGLHFVEAPQDLHLSCANASFDLTFDKSRDGVVEGTRVFRRTSEIITPEQYPAFRDFITKVSEADNKQYAIK